MTDPTPLRKLQQALDGWSRFEDTAHVFFSVRANSDVKSFLSMGELREIVEACTEGRSALLDIVRERYGLLPPWPRDRAARGLSPHKDIKRLPVSDQWSKASTPKLTKGPFTDAEIMDWLNNLHVLTEWNYDLNDDQLPIIEALRARFAELTGL